MENKSIPAESVTMEFIGNVRRRLFAHIDCEWNGVVRDITAQMERPGELVNTGLVCVQLAEFYRASAHWKRFKIALVEAERMASDE